MDEGRWTFGRRGEQLTLAREKTAGGVNLVITGQGFPRSFPFDSLDRLVAFQGDMESLLVRTGWSLLSFSPDRRTPGDRRMFPRLRERRRWWTDAVGMTKRPTGGRSTRR
jgi:hypothetical protein